MDSYLNIGLLCEVVIRFLSQCVRRPPMDPGRKITIFCGFWYPHPPYIACFSLVKEICISLPMWYNTVVQRERRTQGQGAQAHTKAQATSQRSRRRISDGMKNRQRGLFFDKGVFIAVTVRSIFISAVHRPQEHCNRSRATLERFL